MLSERAKKYWRYLRITWSSVCGIACLLLIALWIRSYWQWDGCSYFDATHSKTILSGGGVFTVSIIAQPGHGTWERVALPPQDAPDWIGHLSIGWYPDETADVVSLVFPQWLAIALIGTLGALPWIFARFTIRRLLIFTACIAAVLGTLAYFSKR